MISRQQNVFDCRDNCVLLMAFAVGESSGNIRVADDRRTFDWYQTVIADGSNEGRLN